MATRTKTRNKPTSQQTTDVEQASPPLKEVIKEVDFLEAKLESGKASSELAEPEEPEEPHKAPSKKTPPKYLTQATTPDDPVAKEFRILTNPSTGLACGFQRKRPGAPERRKYFQRLPSAFSNGLVLNKITGEPLVYQDPNSLRFYPTVFAPSPCSWDTFLSSLARACKLVGLYSYQGLYAYFDKKSNKIVTLENSLALSSWMRARIRIWSKNEDGLPVISSLVRDDEARVFNSNDFKAQLPKITRINTVSLPCWGQDGKVHWPGDGFDPITGTYTVQECKPDPFLLNHPKSAMKYLDSLFGEFQFLKKEVDFPAALCQLLSTYCADLLVQYDNNQNRREAISPLIASTANDSNAGKTLILQLMSLPAYGPIELTTLPNNEHHRRQELLTAMKEGKAGIILDETRSTVSSTLLALITSDFTGRLLGVNESIHGRLKIAMAGPQMELDGQTSRRTIMCKLYTLTGPGGRTIKRPMDTNRHHKFRPHLLAIAYHLVNNWAKAGCPLHKLKNRNDWPTFAEMIGGILEANGFETPFYERSGPCLLTESDPQQALVEFVKGLANNTFSYVAGENFENVGLPIDLFLGTMKKVGFLENIPNDPNGKKSFGRYISTYANLPRPIHGYLLKKKRMNSGMILWLTPVDNPQSYPKHIIKRDPVDGKFERA